MEELAREPRPKPVKPLFVFKMTAKEDQLVFLPALETMEPVMTDLLNLPQKLSSVFEIESEVIPLLSIPDIPVCSVETCPVVERQLEEAKAEVIRVVRANMERPRALAQLYDNYSHLLSLDADSYVQEWFSYGTTKPNSSNDRNNSKGDSSDDEEDDIQPHSLQETKAEIERFQTAIREVNELSPSEVTYSAVRIDCQMIKEQLVSQAQAVSTKLMDGLAMRVREQCQSIAADFDSIMEGISAKPQDAQGLAALRALAADVRSRQIPHMKEVINDMQAVLKVLEEFLYSVDAKDFALSWNVVRFPGLIQSALKDTEFQIEADNERFQTQLAQEREQVQKNVTSYRSEVETFTQFGLASLAEMEEYASQVEALQAKLDKVQQAVDTFNERDAIFEVELTSYDEFEALKKDFEPHYQLWSTASDFHASHALWMTGPFIELDPITMEHNISTWFNLMFKLEKTLAESAPEPAKVAEEMREKIAEFKTHFPIVQWLRNPGLRPRHWNAVSEIIGQTINPDHALTLSAILQMPVHKHAEKIEEICCGADKEYGLEQALDKMVSEWRDVQMEIDDYKETKTYILKKSDDILSLLDDQILKTQAMRSSPYIKPFEARTKQWEARLQLIASIMEEWLQCQKTWLYLEPIFSSEDIMRQMPTEGRRFGVVDSYWRKTMDAAKKTPNVLEFVSDTDSLLKGFQESNKMLDLIGKGLNDYLETKRLSFPRFYFLSNDELLNILSQTKNPTAVQPHLNKCFDNMVSLEFSDSQIISAMYSAEGEKVNFIEEIDPNQGARKGNVEVWLKDVERLMKDSLKHETKAALESIQGMTREDWVLGPPGQVVLAISQVMWTRGVENAMRNGGQKALKAHVDFLNNQLRKLVELVRGDLTNLQRLTLGALTVLDVHARDVVVQLAEDGVENPSDFDWLSKLRYYWEDGDQLRVKMINTSMNYGYEYLGNSSRLVITPLTDRAYATLMGAVHLHLGGAPEGPAGTGKTETVKDLAKAIGIQCVVFNCSDGLDYLAMAKFFKGLASSGAWSCFDEFNRIELEVLSVIAQQISSIQRAICEGKKAFFFEGVNIPLVPTCSVFITMNPGYAGRSELPDNLKALFRTVAMMVPDYALIAEIVLYSFGYSEARVLSKKIVACLRLSSEQLSSQDHYDFGMRNLKSILTAAGSLKRSQPETREDVLCFRAINDCNLPKFTSSDIPLFNGITRDLFPEVDLPATNYELLMDAVQMTARELNLQATESFLRKTQELYETINVRHGLMVVGQTYGGKSSLVKVLAGALNKLAGEPGFHKVHCHFLNPKSITQGQLYGEFDKNTHEWADGVLPVIFRDCVADTSEDRHWVVFDGPVDALWIENMNTVLDDNKKLCLASGEIIKISNRMNLIFEVEDLAVASPATVSRCGMVYAEPAAIGFEPVFESWLNTLPITLEPHKERIRDLFEWIVPQTLEFIQHDIKSIHPCDAMGYVTNLCRIFSSQIDEFRTEESENTKLKKNQRRLSQEDITIKEKSTFVEKDVHKSWIESIFLFSTVWSLGSNTDTEGREKFSDFLSTLVRGVATEDKFNNKKVRTPFPDSGKSSARKLVHDYMFHKTTNSWKYWLDTVPPFKIEEGTAFNDIIVPTLDTVRYSWLLETLITHQQHVLFTGETGTGKSITINRKIVNELDKSIYIPLQMAFSARTSANQTQDIIDGKLERRRQGVLGPPLYKKCIVFVDDLNMPSKEEYGAQPPIELLRQFMDYSGWYDRTSNKFREIVDTQFIAAMGLPGGGRNVVSKRYLRHFTSICLTPYDNQSLKLIFSTIMSSWVNRFSPSVRAASSRVVDSTVSMYNAITSQLLPTPAKSHYTFNLRDMSKVFQGVLSVSDKAIQEPNDLIRLWSHEITRVFSDRLVCVEDQEWFQTELKKTVKEEFKISYEAVVSGSQPLLYVDFADPRAPVKQYEQVKDYNAVKGVVENLMQEYNTLKTNKMNLVMFSTAIQHIARINRVLRQPRGNALLVGVGGSGRQSLTRLAAYISDYEVFQIEITKQYSHMDWREDLKTIMRKAGVSGKPVVFLFSDTQIKDESFLEDVNNILNNGEVPNLFPSDEKMQIIEEVQPYAKKAGEAGSVASIYSHFIRRCQQNIHVVMCMSPIGAEFRNRLRMFPALVNCTTIDWFHAWPKDALRSVATRFLSSVDLPKDVKTGVVDFCVEMHKGVTELSAEFLQALDRQNYVTPTSYLELIKTFLNLFEAKRNELSSQKERYENGLKKLEETAEQVQTMQKQLEVLQPQLIVSSKETDDLMKTIETKTVEVSQTRAIVEVEEKECNAQADAAQKIKNECTAQLAEAMPALEAALKALQVIKKNDLVELKSMKAPPAGVIITMQALCIMMEVAPVKVGDVGKKKDDYWEAAKKTFLRDSKFIETLKSYDKDNIAPAIISNIRPLLKNPEFAPAKVAKASRAAEGFCKWVRAMEVYDRVAKEVAPRKEALKLAEDSLSSAMEQLNVKKAQMKEVEDLLADLNTQFEQVNKKKVSLEKQVEECSKRLERAEKLIGGLSGQKKNWEVTATRLNADFHNVVGNILISSGLIAYLGVFTSAFRQSIIEKWVKLLQEKNIPCDNDFALHRVLGDKVQIRQWNLAKLPKDDFSVDNAIIVHKAMRRGLFIDPQGQANRWLKNMVDPEALKIVKQTDNQFARTVTNAVQFGQTLIVENVGETLDPLLEPLLLQNTFSQGGRLMISLGGEAIEYNPKFELFLTTKLSNPHYTPEISTKVTLINFMITPEGLEDQMLGIVVTQEEPALEKERGELIVKSAENMKQLQEIEDKILRLLNESQGMILDDEELIETLQKSKVAASTIEKRMAAAAKTEERINKTRMEYAPVAKSAANLFFCISQLTAVDPMYQYSLDWFIHLFVKAIDAADDDHQIQVRTSNIDQTFTYSLYRNVCRSLFEKDKLLFSFLLCLNVLENKGQVNRVELRFLLTGGIGEAKDDNPAPAWISNSMWNQIANLSALDGFSEFASDFTKQVAEWQQYYEHHDPLSIRMPVDQHDWNELSAFRQLLVLRCLRPDKLVQAIQQFVESKMGKKYIEPPAFDLEGSFADSDQCTPLVFILSQGVNPSDEVFKFAESRGFSGLESISLGQGQGPIAEAAIREAVDKGTWVFLQNCHLAVSWLPTLERIIEELNMETTNSNFRLWLTSMPSKDFPVSVLQNGVKMTNEPPKGLRANMLQTYNNLTQEKVNASEKPDIFQRMLYGLSMFHGIVLERRKFGPLGWNIPYEFTEGDLSISVTQLRMFIDLYDDVPYDALRYLIGQLNYGGRVTDDWDRRTITHILNDFVSPKLLQADHTFDTNGAYSCPEKATIASSTDSVSRMPLNDDPEVFGLHENANITSAIKESSLLLNTLLSLQPKTVAASGLSREDIVAKLSQDILFKIPANFDVRSASKQYPIDYSNSMNTVLVQELGRFNRLLNVVRNSLVDVQKAIKGEILLSQDLEAVFNSLYDGYVPQMWSDVAYPSLKPLGSWVADLLARLEMFQSWLDNGPPGAYWISGFFFTQSFLTGTLQNYARKTKIPIDQLSFDFKVMGEVPEDTDTPPEDGCYIYGLYIEGATWDSVNQVLAEAFPKQLYSKMPVLWLKPVRTSDINTTKQVYRSPVYKTSRRAGTLSTTGHSTNFVLAINLPSAHPESHWVKRGVAMLCQLDD